MGVGRSRAGRVQAADDNGLQPARPVAVPQPHVLVRHQRRLPRQAAGPRARVPHRPHHQGRGHVRPRLELRRQVSLTRYIYYVFTPSITRNNNNTLINKLNIS
jgi:hypothetical protein